MSLVVIGIEELRSIIREEVNNSIRENSLNTPGQIEDNILDINEAMSIIKLSKQTIYSLTSKGEIPFFKRSKLLYFKKAELLKWLYERREKQLKFENKL